MSCFLPCLQVPRSCEIPGLGDWVTDQRRQYKAFTQGQTTQMSDARREKLEEISFAWSVRNRPEWDARYNELLEYKSVHGDCKVPQQYKSNKALGKWVAKQREQYNLLKNGKRSFLTPYRVEKLQQAGFVWQIRTALDTEVRTVMAESAAAAVAAAVPKEEEEAPAQAAVDSAIHQAIVDEIGKDTTDV